MQRLFRSGWLNDPRKRRTMRLTAMTLLVVFAFVLPSFSGDYWLEVATMVMFYIILSLGLNIVVGFTGLLDLGYAAFFAVGAYTTGILTTDYHISYWISFVLAGLFAAVAGVIIGAPTLRLRSDYLAIVTLGFGEIVQTSANNLQFTGAATGIYGIPRPHLGFYQFSGGMDIYYLMLVLALLVLFFVVRLENSRIGRALKYIREDEDVAEAMGINRVRLKLLAYTLGGTFAGFAGSLFAINLTAIAPQSFSFMQSVMVLLAIVLGGLGRLPGVVLGAVLVIVLPELMRSFSSSRLLVFGILLVVMMIFRPQGLWPTRRDTAPEVKE